MAAVTFTRKAASDCAALPHRARALLSRAHRDALDAESAARSIARSRTSSASSPAPSTFCARLLRERPSNRASRRVLRAGRSAGPRPAAPRLARLHRQRAQRRQSGHARAARGRRAAEGPGRRVRDRLPARGRRVPAGRRPAAGRGRGQEPRSRRSGRSCRVLAAVDRRRDDVPDPAAGAEVPRAAPGAETRAWIRARRAGGPARNVGLRIEDHQKWWADTSCREEALPSADRDAARGLPRRDGRAVPGAVAPVRLPAGGQPSDARPGTWRPRSAAAATSSTTATC